MQTKRGSSYEIALNLGSGFFVSWAIQFWVIPFMPGNSAFDAFLKVALFTVASVIRSYIWRRIACRWDFLR